MNIQIEKLISIEFLYSYIHGILAFGWEETNFYDLGEKEAKIVTNENFKGFHFKT